ncbi:MAG: glycoside hydrolase family 25 domain-containing protein [Minisyncoccota bacterium]
MISKTTITALSITLAFASLALPAVASASTLSSDQVQAIVGLLEAFNVDQSVVTRVERALGVSATPASSSPISVSDPPDPPPAPHIPPIGSPYPSSNLGFDLSYNALSYPSTGFNFGIVGISGGKAFAHNNRLLSEYSWTRFGAVASTVYMNLNAPYGSTMVGNISTPKSCPAPAATTTEPTACEGYNYGYNAAKDAYVYAKGTGVSSKFWWLDIEEANSWSNDPTVNDATIQGAIDYLNVQNIRVGIYSAPRMWQRIAGDFVPTQTLSGQAVSIPNWYPVGIMSQTDALNACVNDTGFILGSPIWLVQYEASSTAVDQNVAC